jgi:phosphatidylserine/phosphatidylglycerophosphate/cardiolipin synthase-like enzyme
MKFTILVFSLFVFVFSALALQAQVTDVFDNFAAQTVTGKDSEARIRLITENQEAWYARWHIIDNAKETIDCTYFLLEDDAFGRSFLGLLIKKAEQGVKLRFMVDPRGSMGFSRLSHGQDLLQEMVTHENIEVKVFNPIGTQLLNMFDDIRNPIASNHDKILIVDSRWVIIGGRNISKDYLASPEDHTGAWRDTDVLMESETIAVQAKLAFDDEFARLNNYTVKEDFIDFKSQRLSLEIARRVMQTMIQGNKLPDPSKFDDMGDMYWMLEEIKQYPSLTGYASFRPWEGQRSYPVALLDKHALQGDRNDISPNIIKLMDGAQKSIYLQNPYIVLTDDARAALQRASDRGVRIVVSTNSPASTDSLSTQAFFLLDWKNLLKDMPNMEIHCFKSNTQLHAKVFSFDDEIAVIGTYNMDPLSEYINSEIVVAVKSKAFAMRNRLRIDNDIASSIQYKIELAKDGEIKVLVGPTTHCSQEILDKIKKLQKLGFLRSII